MDEDLFSAIEGENYRLARDLVTKGARSDTLVRDGLSALHLISGYESQDASKILEYCAKKSDTNVKSSEGLTPLHIAALWGRLHNLKILIRYGGDINLTDDDGNNALDLASLSGENDSEGCAKFLLELELQKSKPSSAAIIASGESIIDSPEKYHEQSTDNFSESFFTALGDDSVLDHTVVTFPKLHPWNVKIGSTDFDVTVIDKMNDLSVSDCRFADPDVIDNTVFDEGYTTYKEQSFAEQVSIDDPEFGDTTIFYDWKECSSIMPADEMTDHNESVVIPESLQHLSTPELREKLKEHGEIPGPITPVTRNVYIKRLARLNSGTTISKDSQFKEYLPELRKHMEGRADTPDLCLEEESMCLDFDLKKNWREGTEKSSFNYLLIDPRVTQNLPVRAKKMDPDDVFRVFVMAIFYVGKGKRSRPYAHLNEALQSSKHNAKIQQIRDIWAAGLGVVSLHIFQSVIPVEAYTREACMIDALGLSRLTNKKRGDYYGRAQAWPQRKRREMGVYLLKRALKILLNEGERQLRPGDLRVTHSN